MGRRILTGIMLASWLLASGAASLHLHHDHGCHGHSSAGSSATPTVDHAHHHCRNHGSAALTKTVEGIGDDVHQSTDSLPQLESACRLCELLALTPAPVAPFEAGLVQDPHDDSRSVSALVAPLHCCWSWQQRAPPAELDA